MATALATILVDGSILEGGGQLLRNAVAYAALLGKPVQVHNIRDNRKPPGLKNQHAAGIKLAAELCGAQLTGGETGSRTMTFLPSSIKLGGSFTADPGTAGATTLLLQLAFPILVFSATTPCPDSTTLTLRGGTHATFAPQADYTSQVLLPFLRKHLGLNPTFELRRRGYYPKGGGEVVVTVPPIQGPLPAFNVTKRGEVRRIGGRAYVAGVLPAFIANKMASAARETLLAGADPALPTAAASGGSSAAQDESVQCAAFDWSQTTIEIDAVQESPREAFGTGSGIVLWAETDEGCVFGASSIGSKGRDARKVGKEAAQELLRALRSGGCVDEHLQDQVIIFMALANGLSTVRAGPLTLHTRTAIWLAETLAGAKFDIDESEPGTTTIRCKGIGFRPSEPEMKPQAVSAEP